MGRLAQRLLTCGTAGIVLLAGCALLATGCRTMRSPYDLSDEERAPDAFDQTDLGVVLERHVDGHGRVDYAALRADREPLDRYVARLEAVGPASTPERFPTDAHRLAYWLNAYNALVLFQVVERESLGSVGDAKLRFFWWTRFAVDGRRLNLYAIENDVIRGGFGEPRVHFALNCASLGCPRLPREPFEAERLEHQLARETAGFLAEERNVAIEDGAIVLSELFDWFAEDFGGDPAAWVRAHAPQRELPVGVPVHYRPWDWSSNAQQGPR